MLEQFIFLALGLIGLWVGSDFLIKGTKNIATHFGISEFLIGLAFISIGTSIPEIAVSIAGGLNRLAGTETSGIVVGNALGSALGQISLLFGILAFLVPLRLSKEQIIKHGSFLIASVLLIFGLASDLYFSRLDGIIMVLSYFAYYLFIWSSAPKKTKLGRRTRMNLIQDLIFALTGLAVILFTSKIVVDSGVELAKFFNVSQSLIGILLIGIGTGLPELSVAIAGYRQRAMKISMGALIGSNICDLLLSLGAGTIIAGFIIDPTLLWFDLPVLLGFSFLVLYLLYTGRRISKREGALLISLFVIYALIKIFITG